jgi:hypothetical protein
MGQPISLSEMAIGTLETGDGDGRESINAPVNPLINPGNFYLKPPESEGGPG